MYKRRNEVERLFRRLKGLQRIFSRFKKIDAMFLGFLSFVLVADDFSVCVNRPWSSANFCSCVAPHKPANSLAARLINLWTPRNLFSPIRKVVPANLSSTWSCWTKCGMAVAGGLGSLDELDLSSQHLVAEVEEAYRVIVDLPGIEKDVLLPVAREGYGRTRIAVRSVLDEDAVRARFAATTTS